MTAKNLQASDMGPNSPLKKGATAGLPSSASEKTPENTAGQASSGAHNLQNRLFQQAAEGSTTNKSFTIDKALRLRRQEIDPNRKTSKFARRDYTYTRLLDQGWLDGMLNGANAFG